jgi:hypothetical protein
MWWPFDLGRAIHVMGNFVYPAYPIIHQPKEDPHPHVRAVSCGVIE